jgi:hypothetical protein
MIQPNEQWIPITSYVSYGEDDRSPELLDAALDSLDVEHVRRYQPADGKTYCNIFVTDSTLLFGCEIPHQVSMGELNASGMAHWLDTVGRAHGWTQVAADEARDSANAGFPTVATWSTPHGHGHIAMVRPSPQGGPLFVAQAGAVCRSKVIFEAAFGEGASKTKFWTHQ